MIYVADTNFTLRFAHRSDPQHSIVRSAARKLRKDGNEINILPQTCIEFWNVTTRPVSRNGFGFSAAKADHSLSLIERIFPLLPDNANIYQKWRKLIVDFGVSGVQVHDARIVAAMKTHAVTHILTFNAADFTRYVSIGVVALDPRAV